MEDASEPAVLGFDFPIGVPRAYANRAGIADFMTFLSGAGQSVWRDFFDVADAPGEIRLHRPFYPRRYLPKGSRRRSHLTSALGLDYNALLRRCERASPTRGAACSLFWTCGGNQVGKGALAGWRLLQAEPRSAFLCWPFDGPLDALVQARATVVVETYPAEFMHHLGLVRSGSKRQQEVRQAHGPALAGFARELGVELDAALEDGVHDGFGAAASGEDPFDAVVGLLGMLNVLEHGRPPGDPSDDPAVHAVEGWILGQAADGS